MVRVLLVGLLLAVPSALRAQCADGSPPPCAHAAPAHAPTPNSVAVLYFDNLSRDTADAYLADGLTEEIIIRLGQVQRLEVKSRFEVLRYRSQRLPDPPVLGRSLDAAYLVTGSVQRAGDQVRRMPSRVAGSEASLRRSPGCCNVRQSAREANFAFGLADPQTRAAQTMTLST